MNHSIDRSGLLFVIVLFYFSFTGMAQNIDKKFLYSVESYQNSRDLQNGSQYSNLLFELNPQKRHGRIFYTARLRKAKDSAPVFDFSVLQASLDTLGPLTNALFDFCC
jgi:hypothetical protein